MARLRDTPACGDSRSRPVRLLRGRSRLARSADVLEQLVRAGRAGAVILHRVAEELRDVVQPGILGVPDVLPVVVARLEGVVLDGDEVIGDIIEAGLSGSHGSCLPFVRAGCRRYPSRAAKTSQAGPARGGGGQ